MVRFMGKRLFQKAFLIKKKAKLRRFGVGHWFLAEICAVLRPNFKKRAE